MTRGEKRFRWRKRLTAQQKGRCYYCGQRMIVERFACLPRHATLDHIIPKSHGGTRCSENIVAACFECNTHRGDQDARMFLLEKRGELA